MFKRLIASLVCFTFIFSNLQYVQAQDFSVNQLPVPGIMIGESVPFAPLALKGLIVNTKKPLEFQFIVDTGKGPQDTASIKEEANQLVKYFLAGLTIPEGDLWVNLSPYEKYRMVPEALGQTDLGRDLLAQDYILKQLTASLIYPEKDLGKEFWNRVYAKAQQQFGTTNVPVNTFNKVWILPDQAQVFENGSAAYVTKSTLKVMLDEDYLAKQKHQATKAASISSQIVREIILPEIEKEVNTGKNFAPLRQIYGAMILAKWYKETIENRLLDALYTNKNKTAGINLNDPVVKEQIYNRYLQAYKKGVFNFIKETPRPNGQVDVRKYFSGGIGRIEPLRVAVDGTMSAVTANGPLEVITVLNQAILTPQNPDEAMGSTFWPVGSPGWLIWYMSNSFGKEKRQPSQPTEPIVDEEIELPSMYAKFKMVSVIENIINIILSDEGPRWWYTGNLRAGDRKIIEALEDLNLVVRRQMPRHRPVHGLNWSSFDTTLGDREIGQAIYDLISVICGDEPSSWGEDRVRYGDGAIVHAIYSIVRVIGGRESLEHAVTDQENSPLNYGAGNGTLIMALQRLMPVLDHWYRNRKPISAPGTLAPSAVVKAGEEREEGALARLDALLVEIREKRRAAAEKGLHTELIYRGNLVYVRMEREQDKIILAGEKLRVEVSVPEIFKKIPNFDSLLNHASFELNNGSLTLFLKADEKPGGIIISALENSGYKVNFYHLWQNVFSISSLKAEVSEDAAMFVIGSARKSPVVLYDKTRLADKASITENGGIDLNQIAIKRTGHVINVQFDPAQLRALEQGGFEGFTAVITDMERISSPLPLLGINTPKQIVQLAKI